MLALIFISLIAATQVTSHNWGPQSLETYGECVADSSTIQDVKRVCVGAYQDKTTGDDKLAACMALELSQTRWDMDSTDDLNALIERCQP